MCELFLDEKLTVTLIEGLIFTPPSNKFIPLTLTDRCGN